MPAMTEHTINLLTRAETARLLRVSVSWLARGNGPKPTRLGRKVFYLFDDCRRYIEQQRSLSESVRDG